MFLRRILEAVKDVKKAIQEHTKSVHAAEEGERDKKPCSEVVHRIIAFDDKTVSDVRADSDRQHSTQNSIKLATWCAVVAAIIYASIAAYQGCEMRRATRATEKAAIAAKNSANISKQTMHVDQRPWMNVIVGQTPLQDGSPIVMQVRIINSGKTPAFNVQGLVIINLLKETEEPDFNYAPGIHPKYSINAGTAIPNVPNDLSWPVLPKRVPENKPIKPILTTKAIRDGIQSGNLYIVVHGRITYDDIFGVGHWIKFCNYAHNAVRLPASKATADTCGPYNDVDKNEEKQENDAKEPN
jgi:hypothetical protein